MKSTIYGNWLPMSAQVKKGWGLLPYSVNIMCCIVLADNADLMFA